MHLFSSYWNNIHATQISITGRCVRLRSVEACGSGRLKNIEPLATSPPQARLLRPAISNYTRGYYLYTWRKTFHKISCYDFNMDMNFLQDLSIHLNLKLQVESSLQTSYINATEITPKNFHHYSLIPQIPKS